MIDVRWVKIDSWHLIEKTWIYGTGWLVQTRCGLTRSWDQTFLDRLPGGDEKSCENCLKITVREIDAPATEATEATKPRRRGKSK
jgi:hypothetical protein